MVVTSNDKLAPFLVRENNRSVTGSYQRPRNLNGVVHASPLALKLLDFSIFNVIP